MRFITVLFLSFFSLLQAEILLQQKTIQTQKYTATISYKTLPNSTKSLLYIHGFNDYFFNTELAEKFLEKGYSFYAIDLHHYGRSLKKKDKQYYFTDIAQFDEELTQTLHFIQDNGSKDLTLYGYSQGALIALLYAQTHAEVKRLILDSAFLDFAFSPFLENYILPVVAAVGCYFPEFKIDSKEPNIFGQTMHKDFKGEWDFDLNLKQTRTNAPIYLGWIHAIYEAQKQIKAGLDLKRPVLSLYSHQSHTEQSDISLHFKSDLVLDVKDITLYSAQLNKDKTLTTQSIIHNAMHGVTLSQKEVREKAYEEIFKWLQKQN